MTYEEAIHRAAEQASDGHLLRLGVSAHQLLKLRSVTPDERTVIVAAFMTERLFNMLP
tara:strand:- start:4469 stop:4642 length:174 start_codon:yes stop_codon:yes gene_type:complete